LRGPRIATMASIRSVEVPDQFTLRIGLHWPDPTLLSSLAVSPAYLHLEDLVAYDPRRVRDVGMSRYIDPNLREVKLRHSPI
jgi:MarR-like DNA-binding transcriptional regulator SgrR of sgrS sRNA